MTSVSSLSFIAKDFIDSAHAQVWCSVATLDTQDRPRTRVLHPIWEYQNGALTGWVATGRHSVKAKHLAGNPHVSLCYMKDPLKPTYADCVAGWVDEPHEKRRIWELLATTPEPVGYDPTPFFGSMESPEYGVLKLIPWRIELADLFGESRVWKQG